MIGIYKITNKKNNLVYIGQSKNIEHRITSHMRSYEDSEIDNEIKQNPCNFTYEIIETCPEEKLNEREIYWIKFYNSYYNGYNNTLGGSFYNCPEKDSIKLLNDNDIRLIRNCYSSHQFKSGAEVQRKFFPNLDKHLIARVYNGQERMDIMPEVYQKNYTHKQTQKHQLGELNPAHILTEEEVLTIRALYSFKTRNEIFELFPQINNRTITSIISGQNWKGLPIYHKREKRWTYPQTYEEEEINQYKNKIKEILKLYGN